MSPSRDVVRISAFGLAALLQLAAIWLIVNSLVVPEPRKDSESETQLVLLPTLPPALPAKPKRRQASGTGVFAPYFNPYTFNPQALSESKQQGLAFALSACDVGHYDMAADEIRAACDRIGALIKRDPGRFGFTSEVAAPQHWQRELARREAPFLMVCAKPTPPANKDMIVGIDLATLLCVYDLLMNGYDPEKRARYSQ